MTSRPHQSRWGEEAKAFGPGEVIFVLWPLAIVLACVAGQAADTELRAMATETNGVVQIEYWSGNTRILGVPASAPAGVELLLPGSKAAPVQFRTKTEREGIIELGPARVGALTLRWRLHQETPALVQRTLEVNAEAAQRFSVTFPLEVARDGEFITFSGPAGTRTLYDTVRGSARTETFPVVMLRTSGEVFGLVADSPGLWENRCQMLLDPPARRLAILTGDGRDPYPLIIKPPEDARDTYQYQMDGWQSLAAGETRSFTTWVFASPARTHYDAQVAAHLAVANAKGWNSSVVEAILRNTSLYLLRRNLALDADNRPRDGRYIFISGPGYGWKQWVSDGFYTALGLDDPEKTIEANRAVFWTRMDYEDNAQYYLIWAVLMKRAGGTVNEALVRQAYEFLRRNEKDGLFIPPPLPGAPNAKGWKTYHDVLPYDDDDSPASNQGFHCGALLAAQELGLAVTGQDIERAIAAYRSLFNTERGFMPTSRKLRDTLGQDTLYGATLTYAVFGRKLLTDEQVLTHYRTSEKVKTPYGLRVISQADGSLLPGHSGVYCYGGSWFLNDAANYLLAGVHGLPAEEVDALLVERIAREIAHVPAFNESISTVDGRPHGHILYSWNSGYWWLRRQIRQRLGQTGPDPVDAAIDRRLGVVRENGALRLEPDRVANRASLPAETGWSDRLIGYTELLDLTKDSKEFTYGFTSSRDGKRISYHQDYQVFLADADGSHAAQVPTGHPFNFGPTWSPDGQWVLFLSGEHHNCHPYIVRADGTGLRKLADRGGYRGAVEFLDVSDFHEGSSDTPVWSADGKRVFYTAKDGLNVELFQVTIDGASEQLTRSPNGTIHYHPEPSPDGQWPVYGSKRGGVRQLFVRRLEDRVERQLTGLKPGHAAMWPHWRPLAKPQPALP